MSLNLSIWTEEQEAARKQRVAEEAQRLFDWNLSAIENKAAQEAAWARHKEEFDAWKR